MLILAVGILAFQRIGTFYSGPYSFTNSVESPTNNGTRTETLEIWRGAEKSPLVHMSTRELLDAWLKSDSFWGGKERAEQIRKISAHGSGALKAEELSCFDLKAGFIVRIGVKDTTKRPAVLVENVTLGWDASHLHEWQVLDHSRANQSIRSEETNLNESDHQIYIIGEKSIKAVLENPLRLKRIAELPQLKGGIWGTKLYGDPSNISMDRGIFTDPLYADFDIKAGKVWLQGPATPFMPEYDSDLKIPKWEQANRKDLSASKYRPRVLWRQVVDPKSTVQSTGGLVVITGDTTRIVDPATGKTIRDLPRMLDVKSDGKIAVCVEPLNGDYQREQKPWVEGIDLKSGTQLWRFSVKIPPKLTEPVDSDFYMETQEGLFRIALQTGKVIQKAAPKSTPEGGRAFSIVATKDYLYVDWNTIGLYALNRLDLNKGKVNDIICHPIGVTANRLVVATNFVRGCGSVVLDGTDYKEFPFPYFCEKPAPVVSDGMALSMGQIQLAGSGGNVRLSPRYMFAIDVASNRILWKKELESHQHVVFGSHLAILREVSDSPPAACLEIRDIKTGALQWRTMMPKTLDLPSLATANGTLLAIRGRIITAYR